MRIWPLVFTLFVLFEACSKDGSKDVSKELEKSYNVILIVGQSNTHYGIGLNTSIDTPSDHIKQLGRKGLVDLKIISAIEPLYHHTRTAGKIGFGLSFAKRLYTYLGDNKEILIIPCGYASTSFKGNNWNKGDALYEDAINRVNFILNKYPGSKLITVLWHQGESDVGNINYQKNLDDFIVNIRTDLGDESIPFILGGMVPYWVNQNSSRQAQQEIIANSVFRHDNVGYVNPTVPFLIEKEDNTIDQIHYNAIGQRELGNRYFDQFVSVLEE